MTNRGQGSAGVAIAVTAVVIIALSSLGYYQYVYVPSGSSSTTTSTSITGTLVQINITVGAAGKTDDAYSPNPVKLVIGVNNTFVVYNGDLQNGVGVPHSYTDRTGAFDTGILQGGDSSNPIRIDTPGSYNVYCVVHPTTMRGKVVVVQGTAGGKAPSTRSSSNTTISSVTSATTTTSSTFSSSSSAASRAGVTVTIPFGTGTNTSSAGFAPDTITVVIGVNNTVAWVNKDNVPHTVTAADKSFDSGNMNAGASYTFTFTVPGQYKYGCQYHSWMHGTVVVKARP